MEWSGSRDPENYPVSFLINFALRYRYASPMIVPPSSDFRFSHLEIGKIPLSKFHRRSIAIFVFPKEFSRDIDRKFPFRPNSNVGKRNNRDVAYIIPIFFRFFIVQTMHSRPVCLQSLTRTASKLTGRTNFRVLFIPLWKGKKRSSSNSLPYLPNRSICQNRRKDNDY